MKKIIISILLVLSLTACSGDPVVDDVPCTDNQIEVDDVCIDLTGQEIQLRYILEQTKMITNYKLEVTILESDTEFEIVMMYEDNKSSIQTLNQIDYYVDTLGVCEHTSVINNYVLIESFDCLTDDTYLFFKLFDYTWFTIVDGRYSLNQDNFDVVETFFLSEFPLSYLESFTMSANDTYIYDMVLELVIDNEIYTIELVISSINEVDIVMPGEE